MILVIFIIIVVISKLLLGVILQLCVVSYISISCDVQYYGAGAVVGSIPIYHM